MKKNKEKEKSTTHYKLCFFYVMYFYYFFNILSLWFQTLFHDLPILFLQNNTTIIKLEIKWTNKKTIKRLSFIKWEVKVPNFFLKKKAWKTKKTIKKNFEWKEKTKLRRFTTNCLITLIIIIDNSSRVIRGRETKKIKINKFAVRNELMPN